MRLHSSAQPFNFLKARLGRMPTVAGGWFDGTRKWMETKQKLYGTSLLSRPLLVTGDPHGSRAGRWRDRRVKKGSSVNSDFGEERHRGFLF